MKVVALEPIGHRRLRTNRFQCRVAAECRHGCIKARIGNTKNTNPFIVAG